MTITEKILAKLQALNGQAVTGAQLRTKMGNRHYIFKNYIYIYVIF